MKINVNVLTVRTKDGLYDAIALRDDGGVYDEILVEYSPQYVTKDNLIEWGRKVYGDRVYTALGHQLNLLDKDLCFTLQGEARHLPSLGDMKLNFEMFELEVN